MTINEYTKLKEQAEANWNKMSPWIQKWTRDRLKELLQEVK